MEKLYGYSQQPTLLIGLGGFGSHIVDSIYARVKDIPDISAFSIDTDVYDSEDLVNIPEQHMISMAQRHPLFECLNRLPDAGEWFPDNSLLLSKTLSEGSGQVRAVSRLAYELSLKEQRFDTLLAEVSRLAEECVKRECRMRVSIVSTLVGGTASGIFIQVALLVREHVSKHFPALNIKIHGELILPSAFLSLHNVPKAERRNMESNAYAALKELNAINEHFFSDTSSVDALPYDYCFLYDRVDPGHAFSKLYIENAITERLFSASANDLNDAFVENLRSNVRKRAGNLYGTICTEKLPINSSIFDSEIFRSIINRTSTDKGKRIFLARSPKKLDIDTALFTQDTVFIEKIDRAAPEISVTELCFGIEISEIEKLRPKSGQYYTSYHSLTEQLPMAITPHLNKNWHRELRNIGEATDVMIPKENFVFISYSSRETEIANGLKHILETNGVPCWMAPQSIPAGSDYGSEIPKAIEKCKTFLLLLSDASQNSNWVPKEVGLAIGKGKIVVPFQIDNAAVSEAFNFYLTNSQRISAYNRMAEAYQELLDRLKDILS